MRPTLILVSLASLLGAATAVAEPSNTKALADQLFQQGRDFAKASNWIDACPKFEASLQYDPAIGTKLNLATCYEWIGKPASAWGLYREVIEEATRTHDKRLAIAKKAAAKLEPSLPKLTITPPSPLPPGLVVERDGIAIAAAELGTAIYVDPGVHHIKATAPGFVPFEHEVTALEAQVITDPLPALEAAPVVVTPPAITRTEPDRPTDHGPVPRSHRRALGLGVGLGGVALVGVGLAFGAHANGKLADAKALCGEALLCTHDNFAADQALIDDSRSAATLSTVLVIVGGAAIAGGLVLYLTAPAQARERIALVPVVGGQQAGLVAMGRF